ncbi:hypothetical protein DW830_13890 [Prevotella sp. AM34-19LB]|nr:hypothetical protein DW830_13890 [Prevotella sp. AM34-19LB]
MKLIVSTFLVYKVKKCLLKSGKVSPLEGPIMPVAWASTAHQAGIHRTSAGQQVPIKRAMSAPKNEVNLGQR